MKFFLALVFFASAVFVELGSSLRFDSPSTPSSNAFNFPPDDPPSDAKQAEHLKKPIDNAPTVASASDSKEYEQSGKPGPLKNPAQSKNTDLKHDEHHQNDQREHNKGDEHNEHHEHRGHHKHHGHHDHKGHHGNHGKPVEPKQPKQTEQPGKSGDSGVPKHQEQLVGVPKQPGTPGQLVGVPEQPGPPGRVGEAWPRQPSPEYPDKLVGVPDQKEQLEEFAARGPDYPKKLDKMPDFSEDPAGGPEHLGELAPLAKPEQPEKPGKPGKVEKPGNIEKSAQIGTTPVKPDASGNAR